MVCKRLAKGSSDFKTFFVCNTEFKKKCQITKIWVFDSFFLNFSTESIYSFDFLDHQNENKDKEMLYYCDICNRTMSFFGRSEFLQHCKSHRTETRPFFCRYCFKRFFKESSLLHHVIKAHPREPRPLSTLEVRERLRDKILRRHNPPEE